MQRLIDAHELWAQIYKLSYKHRWKDRTNIAFSKCLDAIQFFPTVDAEPVVRCKECKYNYHNMIPSGEAEHGCTKCIELPITADFYCAWGEREEDDNKPKSI